MPRSMKVGTRWEIKTCWLGTGAEHELLAAGWEPFSTYYVPQTAGALGFPVLVLRRPVEDE